MSDINLLPDDLKKKEQKILQKKNSFSNSSIEFTSGERLLKNNNNSKNEILNPGLNTDLKRDPRTKNSYGIPKNFVSADAENQNTEQILDLDNLEIIDEKASIGEVKVSPQRNQAKNIEPQRDKNINQILKEKKENGSSLTNKKQEIVKEIPKNIQAQKKRKKDNFAFFKKIFNNLLNKNKNSEEDKSDVNLLPQELNLVSRENIISMIISTLLISIVILFVIYFAILIYKINIDRQINSLDLKIEEIVKNSEDFDKLIVEIEDWKSRIQKINGLLNKHVYWTEFFARVEANTLPEVKFSSFAGSVSGNITLSASAPDYYTVARQWIHLKGAKDFVEDAIIEGASASGSQSSGIDTKINFSLILDLVDDIFYKKNN